MHKYYIDMLICPLCNGKLKWHIQEENEVRIINAKVACQCCSSEYEVRDEIAVFLTDQLSRNDLWNQSESSLGKFLRENPNIYERLMNTHEEALNGADYWFKASFLELQRNFPESSKMFKIAFEKIYTADYINGWESQMNFIVENIHSEEPIIDIASGKGYLIEKLLRKTKNYVAATDFSPTILVRNKEYYKSLGLYDRLSLIAFDARKTPFKTNSIKTMTSNMGLPNIEQAGEVISELSRITQKEFMSIMIFIDKNDTKNMDFLKKFGNTAYATRENALETFKKAGWNIEICNSFMAYIKPTPTGEILEGAGIDGFPVEDTKVEFCVIRAMKQSSE